MAVYKTGISCPSFLRSSIDRHLGHKLCSSPIHLRCTLCLHDSSTTGVGTEASTLDRGTLKINLKHLSQVSSNESTSSKSGGGNNGSLSSATLQEQYNAPLLSISFTQV